jgi:hypothetical protein
MVAMRPVVLAVMFACVLAGCARSQTEVLRELKDEACACKTQPCAAELGARIAKAAVDAELDEAQGKLAMEASVCLAAFGE